MEEAQKSFPALLETLRMARHMSKTDLPKLTKLTPGYISHLTRGERTSPSEETVQALANALGVDQETRKALLEAAGYVTDLSALASTMAALSQQGTNGVVEKQSSEGFILHKEDWNEAPSIDHFYGREKDLALFQRWIVGDRSRVVGVLGIGGVGKTTLAAELARRMKDDFSYVIWCSLRDALPLTTLLKKCIDFISGTEQDHFPQEEDEQIDMLRTYMQKYRCLIIIDNLESVLQSGDRVGQYNEGRQGYGKLINALGEVPHQSCLLLTSREKPRELTFLEGPHVHARRLMGVDQSEGRAILNDKGLSGDDTILAALIERYSGNPLALKLVSAPIRELYAGDIATFLQDGGIITGDISELLNQQFQRLSEQERNLLYWLAIEREVVPLNELRKDTIQPISDLHILEALNSLQRRSLIETNGTARFSLQPVIMEYVTDRFVTSIFEEITSASLALFETHALIKAQTKDYLRESQVHLILKPIAERLFFSFGSSESEQKLKDILALLHRTRSQIPSYAAGNILNLLIQLECDLQNYDFSELVVWQAYLQGADLPGVNFAHADLGQSIFTDTFGGVLAIALSPRGSLLAAGTTNSEIRIWRAEDGLPLFTFEGHADWVRSVTFSPDGSLLASGSDDQTIRIWDVSTGQCLKVLSGHNGRVYDVAFSPNGNWLASGSEDQTVRLWRVKDEEQDYTPISLQGHSSRVRTVAFSPNGLLLASGSEDKTIRLWNVKVWEQVQLETTLKGHTGKVWSVAFHPDSLLLASGSEDQTVRFWDVKTATSQAVLSGHTRAVWSVAFHPNGLLLATSSRDQTVRLWNVETLHCLKVLRDHTNLVMSVCFNFDGTLLASGSEDQTIRIWEVDTGQCIKILQGHSTLRYAVAFSPDGSLLANGNEDQTVRLWNVDTGQCVKILHGHSNRIRSVAFSPDGMVLASGSDDHTIRLWDVRTGQSIKTLRGHKDWVKSVVFSPDGRWLASGSDDQSIRLWDVRTGQSIKTLIGHKDWIWSVAFSPDSTLLASAGEDQVIRIWDIQTEQSRTLPAEHTNAIWSVAFSPDGSMLASGSWDQTICLWDVQSGQCINTLKEHADLVESVVFSPDGSLLASGSWDQTARLWDVQSGQCINVLKGHTSWLYSVAFNPSGDLLGSSSGDGIIRLWDVLTGQCSKLLKSSRPYENMNITDVIGLTDTQRATLKGLGAIEY